MTAMLRSLPVRFALLAFALAVLSATAMGAFIGWRANQLVTARTLEIIRADALTLDMAYRNGGLANLTRTIDAKILSQSPVHYYVAAMRAPVATSDGTIAADKVSAADRNTAADRIAGDIATLPSAIQPLTDQGDVQLGTVQMRLLATPDVKRIAAAIRVPLMPDLVLFVARDVADQDTFIRAFQMSLTAGVLGLTGLSVFGAMAARKHFAARVDAVTDTARTIISGNLDSRIPLTKDGDEIDRLSSNLNDMLDRMAHLMSSLREVSDNIAHDLKTPLNRLRNRAEAALRDPAGSSAYRDGLEKTIEEADGLIRTFNALLLIARLEASTIADSMTVLDPAAVIADVAELYQPVAEESGRTLIVAAQPGLRVSANRQLLGQLISNLVENAIKYGASGASHGVHGRISLSLTGDASGVVIAIGDHGPGIREADRERALKRFGRLEESRTQPGTGLGLSLVAAVARMHGGTLRLEDNDPGLRVVVRLPAIKQSAPIERVPA
jgi:signal transduction histidine kinase